VRQHLLSAKFHPFFKTALYLLGYENIILNNSNAQKERFNDSPNSIPSQENDPKISAWDN
jgi:hypothetical protein